VDIIRAPGKLPTRREHTRRAMRSAARSAFDVVDMVDLPRRAHINTTYSTAASS